MPAPRRPVEVLGFTGVPSAGDRFSVVETEARAREVTDYRQRQLREKSATGGATSLEQMMNQLKAPGIAKFPLIIKGDVQGSVEAIVSSLNKLSTEEVSAQILMSAVGGITESDVTLAEASQRHHHRLQRPRQQAGQRPRDPRRHRNPLLQHHLRPRG